MDKRVKDFNDTLNLIATVPNLLQKNNEKLENVKDSINSNTKRIGNVNAEFAEIHNINKNLLNTLSTLKPEELLKIVKNFKDITEPLKKDIQKIILEEILKNIKENIENIVFKELKTFVTDDFKASTKKIIETYEQETKEKINTLIDSIEQNAEDINTLNKNRVEIKKNIEDLKQNIMEDQEERAREIKQLNITSNKIENKVDEYNFLNSSEFHFYNNVSQATLGAVLTIAGAIKRYDIILILILLAYTVFKGFIAYKTGTNVDKYNLKAINKEFFADLKDKIVFQVLYFLSGIGLIVCNILLYRILNKKMEIDIYKIVTSLIYFIKTYQFVALVVINFIGFIPFLMSNKIENSLRSNGFKFIGYVILAVATIISSYFFITPLFLNLKS